MSNRNKEYKRILSQLFDIKPMKDSADLDWDKIKKVKSVVSLRGKMTENELQMRREALILSHASRSAILRENESLVFVKKDAEAITEQPVNVKSDSISEVEKSIASSQLLFDDYFASVGNIQKRRDDSCIEENEEEL